MAGGLAHHHAAAEEPKAVKRASAFKIGKHGRASRAEPNVGSLRPDQQGFMHHFSSEASEVLAAFYGSDSDRKFSTKLGTFYNDRCSRSEASPVTAQIYFYSFTMLTAFVVFSLFVSVIEMGMFETMEELEAEAREAAAELEDAPAFSKLPSLRGSIEMARASVSDQVGCDDSIKLLGPQRYEDL